MPVEGSNTHALRRAILNRVYQFRRTGNGAFITPDFAFSQQAEAKLFVSKGSPDVFTLDDPRRGGHFWRANPAAPPVIPRRDFSPGAVADIVRMLRPLRRRLMQHLVFGRREPGAVRDLGPTQPIVGKGYRAPSLN